MQSVALKDCRERHSKKAFSRNTFSTAKMLPKLGQRTKGNRRGTKKKPGQCKNVVSKVTQTRPWVLTAALTNNPQTFFLNFEFGSQLSANEFTIR